MPRMRAYVIYKVARESDGGIRRVAVDRTIGPETNSETASIGAAGGEFPGIPRVRGAVPLCKSKLCEFGSLILAKHFCMWNLI